MLCNLTLQTLLEPVGRESNVMGKYNIYTLKIDEEFQNLIPPLSSEERKQLAENIKNDGCREPLCVWNKTILDGHNRYEICTRLQIPFKVSYIFLRSREEAVAWICANQLGRRNITDEARRYLIGRRYEAEKIVGAHNAAGTNQHTRKEARTIMCTEPRFDDSAIRTKERLGREYRISPTTVVKYGEYSQSLDALSKAEPTLPSKILSGQVKMSQENVVELSRLAPSDIRRISANLSENDGSYSGTRNIVPKKKKIEKPDLFITPDGSVKDMPAYDPDAEILSLALTMPSWVSSIKRTYATAKFAKASDKACYKLEEELKHLKTVVDAMLFAIKGEND